MTEDKLMELVRAQGKFIALLQTWIAQTCIFLSVHNINPTEAMSKEAQELRDKIALLKKGE
jgi:hypothetical protein